MSTGPSRRCPARAGRRRRPRRRTRLRANRAASENINLAAARSADGTSATPTWTPPTQPSHQWIFVAAKVSPDAPNITPSIAVSTYRCAGQLLLNTASTLLISDMDPDTEYVYGHTSLRISDGRFVWTP